MGRQLLKAREGSSCQPVCAERQQHSLPQQQCCTRQPQGSSTPPVASCFRGPQAAALQAQGSASRGTAAQDGRGVWCI